jgi:hypothetical protein
MDQAATTLDKARARLAELGWSIPG